MRLRLLGLCDGGNSEEGEQSDDQRDDASDPATPLQATGAALTVMVHVDVVVAIEHGSAQRSTKRPGWGVGRRRLKPRNGVLSIALNRVGITTRSK